MVRDTTRPAALGARTPRSGRLIRLAADDGLGFRETGFPRAETDGLKSALGGKKSPRRPHRLRQSPLIAGLWLVVMGEQAQVLSKIDLHRGNDIPRPRDTTPKIALRPETVSTETQTQPQKPANCGLVGSLWEISRIGRLRGGGCSPDRTSLHVKFPASREFSREFFEKRAPRTILASKTRAGSIAYKQIPCSTEQGIFLREQGILSREQGILRPTR
jgi:hypothetical protein